MADGPYERLGVSPDASDLEIRKAKIKAKKKYHPDRWPEEKKDWARKRYYRIQDAIELIEEGAASAHSGTSGGTEPGSGSHTGGEGDGDTTDAESAGSDGPTDGTGSKPSDDEPPTVRLDVSAGSGRVEVGSTVTFTVEDDDGNPIEGAVLSAAGAGRTETTADGTGELTFESSDEFTVTVEKSGPDATYVSDSVCVTVVPREVELVVEPEAESVDAGETVLVEVFDDAGSLVPDVRLRSSVGHDTEVASGRTRLSFDAIDEGTVKLTASKPDTDDVEYETGTTEIEVERSEVKLTLDPEIYSCDAGDEVKFTVRDRMGNKMIGATVSVDGGETDKTGLGGTCRLPMEEPGSTLVTASMEDEEDVTYHADSVEIDVRKTEAEREKTTPEAGSERDEGERSDSTTTRTGGGDSDTDTSSHTDTDDSETARKSTPKGESTISETWDEEMHSLSLSFDEDTVKLDESVEFVVRDEDGVPVANAVVEAEETGDRKVTDGSGTGEITFETSGKKTLSAVKEDGDRELTSNDVYVSVRPSKTAGPSPGRTTRGGVTADRTGTLAKVLLMLAIAGLMSSFVALIEFGWLGLLAVLVAAGVAALVLVVFVRVNES